MHRHSPEIAGLFWYITRDNPHFTDEETEAQWDEGLCLQWQRWSWHPGLPATNAALSGDRMRKAWACLLFYHLVELGDQINFLSPISVKWGWWCPTQWRWNILLLWDPTSALLPHTLSNVSSSEPQSPFQPLPWTLNSREKSHLAPLHIWSWKTGAL